MKSTKVKVELRDLSQEIKQLSIPLEFFMKKKKNMAKGLNLYTP